MTVGCGHDKAPCVSARGLSSVVVWEDVERPPTALTVEGLSGGGALSPFSLC